MSDPLYSVDGDLRAYALGLGAVEGADWHPRQSIVRCLNCGERSTSDGPYCTSCESDPHEDYERRRAQVARSVQIGRERTAKLLEKIGHPERAAIHRGER